MPAITGADQELCRQLADLECPASPREVRTLREYGAIQTVGSGKGGRGKDQPYAPGSASVVAAVIEAKADDTYARKLHRAVLIAWARGANVGTAGLRRAFDEHFTAEERSSQSLLDGKRVPDGEPDLRFGQEIHRAIAAAQLGHKRSSAAMESFELGTGDVVRVAYWRTGQRNLLPVQDNTLLGLAEMRSDGTWRTTDLGEDLWEALALAPLRKIARAAPRGELDLGLSFSQSMMPAHGFETSDLVAATGAPRHVQFMRRWYGHNWWRRPSKRPRT